MVHVDARATMGGSREKEGGGDGLTRGCKRSRIDCRTISAVGLCGVHQRSCDYGSTRETNGSAKRRVLI